MIYVQTKKLFYIFATLVIILVPILFLPFGFLPMQYVSFIFALLVLEVLIYATYLRIANWDAPLLPLLILSLIITLVRAALCAVSTLFIGLVQVPEAISGALILYLWLGNPVSFIVQVGILCLIIPHFLLEFAPGLLGSNVSRFLQKERSATQEPTIPATTAQQVSSPTATSGFYNVYSFPELEAQLSKSIGLEGFIVFSEEGLVMWEKLHINIDSERLVVLLMTLGKDIKRSTTSLGLAHTDTIIVETDEHLIFNGFVNSVFGYTLIFNASIPRDEMYHRIDMISDSINVLLKTRYQTLVLSRAER